VIETLVIVCDHTSSKQNNVLFGSLLWKVWCENWILWWVRTAM